MDSSLIASHDSKEQAVSERPSVFLAFPFHEKDSWIQHHLPGICASWGFRTEVGSHFHGRPIAESVASTIGRTKLVVCFLMRGSKLAGGGWTASDWVLQELGFARGKGIPVVVVREKGVHANVGLLGDIELIELDPSAPFLALLSLRVALQAMLSTAPNQATLRVHHLARPGAKQHGIQWWDFWTWIDGPADVLERITRVSYVFPRSFRPGMETSSNRAAAFGNYGETDEDFRLQVIVESTPKSKEKIVHPVTLWRVGYE